ncbi:MAG TPA: D-aminoacyl-tRNA deacylase [Candidatus Limnocylindria bacterium]
MRAVLQRVTGASVDVEGERIASIERGLVALVGVGAEDRPEDGERLAAKIASLRIFDDDRGKLSRSVIDVDGAVLAVPQFTLYGDLRDGRRPDFTKAAPPDKGQRLYDAFCGALRGKGVRVESGRFGATMRVHIDGDGPVTIVASTDRWTEGELG